MIAFWNAPLARVILTVAVFGAARGALPSNVAVLSEVRCDVSVPVQRDLHGFASECPAACPFAVVVDNGLEKCQAKCVADASACSLASPFFAVADNDTKTCRKCRVSYCSVCTFDSSISSDVCHKCSEGFVLNRGRCVLQYEDKVLLVVLIGCIVALAFFVIFALWIVLQRDVDDTGSSTELLNITKTNSRAIKRGWQFSVCARCIGGKIDLWNLDRENVVGEGLPLFFCTQVFLIVVALFMYVVMRYVKQTYRIDLFIACAKTTHRLGMLSCNACADKHYRVYDYARAMVKWCLVLWVLLVAASCSFAVLMKKLSESFDRQIQTMEDYALRIEGIPEKMTSEMKLTTILTNGLGSLGDKLHGVSIVYNVCDFDRQLNDGHLREDMANKFAVAADRIPRSAREMIEHLVELDVHTSGYAGRCRVEAIVSTCDLDKNVMRYMMETGRLKSTGVAYLVFKDQESLHMTWLSRRCFLWAKDDEVWLADELKPTLKHHQCIELQVSSAEPTAVHWFNCTLPRREFWRNLVIGIVKMCLGYTVCIGFSFFVYSYFITPYLRADEAVDQGDSAITIVGGFVAALNACVQMTVESQANAAGFTELWRVEKVIFIGNTILVAMNTAFQILSFCDVGGAVQMLHHADALSLMQEHAMASNIVALVQNMFFIQYVLNALGNAVTPVAIKVVVMWSVYVSRRVPKRVKNVLVQALDPQPKKLEEVTVREAEENLCLQSLVLSNEYTFAIVYTAVAISTFISVTDVADTMCLCLLLFFIVFLLYQRFVNPWTWRRKAHIPRSNHVHFMVAWGMVLGILPAAAAWWLWRLGHVLSLAIPSAYAFSFGAYLALLSWLQIFDNMEQRPDDQDKHFEDVVQANWYSWWNMNPMYVLKRRYGQDVTDYECLPDKVKCWPADDACYSFNEGAFFEFGKEFRMLKQKSRSALLRAAREEMRSVELVSDDNREPTQTRV